MKKKFWNESYGIFLLIGILLIASIFSPVQGSDNSNTSNIKSNLNDEDLISIVEQKLNQLNKKDYSLDVTLPYYTQHDTNPLFYVTSLKPTGFMILTTDYALRPILGYSFTSSFNIGTVEHDMFIEFIKTDIEQRILESSKRDDHPNKWNIFEDTLSIQSTSSSEQWPPVGYSTTEGWIETQWHQNSPYNDYCPIDLDSDTRGLAGCPAVAIAQILNYHQTINNVSFNDDDDYTHNYGQRFRIDDDYETYGFPSFVQLNDYLEIIQTHFDQDILLTNNDKAALIFACGTAATQVYTPQVSGTFGVSQAFNAYQKFNCEKNELLTSEDDDLYPRIIQNIKTGFPVHLAIVNEDWNAGHNLIIDGYNTEDYYHLNFGWGGSYDGWYDLPDELPYKLTVIEGVIVDILLPTDTADLMAAGSIQLSDITQGSLVNGNFTIQNDGETGSELSWEIASYPDWGTWSFSQEQGTGLTPEHKEITINVSITIPSEKTKTFTGGIKIINSNSPNDFEVIPLSVTTQKTKQGSILIHWMNLFDENYPLLLKFLVETIQIMK
jgi:hypothetical protein